MTYEKIKLKFQISVKKIVELNSQIIYFVYN